MLLRMFFGKDLGKMKSFVKKGVLVAAVMLILLGISQNDFRDVKNKAIRICYEGIGIG